MSEHLGEYCTFVRGVTFQNGDTRTKGTDGLVPLLRAGNISRRLDLENDVIWVPSSLVSADQQLRAGDIVICLSSGSPQVVGKSAQLIDDWNGTVGAFCGIVRPKQNVDPPFLACWFQSSAFWKWRDMQARGANIQNLRFSELAGLAVSFPPIYQQRRIAARLREELATITEARAALEAQLDAAEALPSANLKSIFQSSEAQRWPCRRLEDISEISGGVTLGRALRERSTRNVAYMRVANVKDGHLDLTDVKTTPATEAEIAALRLKKGDILLTEGGDPDKLGRGTFWRGEIAECIHQNHIFRVRFDASRFEPAFMAFQFGSAYGKAYFAAHAKQTTGIATINRRVLGAFPLMTPPLKTQRALATRLDAEYSVATALRLSLAAKLSEIEKLPAALLRAAFAPSC